MTDSPYSSTVMRGFTQREVLINGLRGNPYGSLEGDINGSGFSTSQFRLTNVERVEVLKGPSSVLYGSAEPGGVINYVTKRPRGEFDARVNYLQSVADYHERLKAFFFPIVFDDTKAIDAVAWRHAPAHRYRDVTSPAGLYGMHGLALGGAAFALLTIGMMRLRAIVSRPG